MTQNITGNRLIFYKQLFNPLENTLLNAEKGLASAANPL